MPRIPRMVRTDSGQRCVYHVISRTALEGLPFKKLEKDELVRVIQRFSMVYAVDVLGFSIMDNHFHLLIEMSPGDMLSDDEVRRRFFLLYNKGTEFPEGQMTHERFKSVIVEKGSTVINCLAYIDLNAVRAGIVKRPEDYRWCSIGYHVQADNRDGFLSLDFGLAEFGVYDDQRLKQYRASLYHAGAIDKRGKAKISKKVLSEEISDDFELDRMRRFRYRTRYFTDSGIIGSKAFVLETYAVFKDRFFASRERVPKRVKGIDGMYSMKRLTEV